MASIGDMRRFLDATRLTVVFLVFAVVVTCVSGPMMEAEDICETLVPASVVCNHAASTAFHTADKVFSMAIPALGIPGSGLLQPQGRRSLTTSTVSTAPSTFVSIPLRA